MHANLLQLNRIAILLSDSESVLARLDPTPSHRADGSIFATVDGKPHVIDRDGAVISAESYTRDALGLTAVAA